MLGKSGRVAVSRGRCGIDHAFHFGIARGHQHIDGAIDVGAIAAQGVEDGFRHGGNRRLMKDEVHSGASLMHGVEVEDVGLTEIDAMQNLCEILAACRWRSCPRRALARRGKAELVPRTIR